ncbi:hypothetical protein HZA99_03585 [Candidatus Woesearchaeota archaeon]|nr:hypothetical protein [Candidatus Woesearchaeota archaeon]
MSMENIMKIIEKPKYLGIWGVVAVFVGWLYIGPLTIQENYDLFAWVFALVFPLLVGFIVAMQTYNLTERKTCPASASTGGVLGSIAGIITVGCPVCPLILLSWLGLAAGGTGGVLGGPWIKLISLIVLGISAYWAAK